MSEVDEMSANDVAAVAAVAKVVLMAGIEPVTSSLPRKCSTD
jgi:hypothetical protein